MAINAIADAGVVMGSQTVLLKGVNDNPEVMGSLMHKLLKNRIKPYYLFQCDPIVGSKHFRTTVAKGQDIIHSLRGFTSGYAVPQYVIDAPGSGGKIPILPNYYKGRDKDNLYIYNYEGKVFANPDDELVAEFDSIITIHASDEALKEHGYNTIRIGNIYSLIKFLSAGKRVYLVFNIC